MTTNFRITGLNKQEWQHLFQMSESALARIGAVKEIVTQNPGFPCRVSLADAAVGEEVILFPYRHHDTESPYQAKGPIFIRKAAENARLGINEVPKMLLHRLLSLRGYNKVGMMLDAITIEGNMVATSIQTLFTNDKIAYIHIHNASPGCYNCQVERVS